ncbi:MAG: HEAT repeat domain-containing protein, partial [Candidatus Aureabacteria bacterium]|nr:HEAT repeat domain-containing protein [Candidatus Auribacterota bacterium]
IGDKSAEKALKKLLSDERTDIRVEALKSLGKLGDSTAEPMLTDIVVSARDKAEVVEAIKALGVIKSPSSVGLLVEKCQDADPEISRAASEALLGYGDKLYECMQSASPDARKDAVVALGLMKKKESTAFIIKGLDDDSPVVRAACLRSLEKIGDKTVIKKSVKMLDDPDSNVKVAAISYLTFCGNTNAVGQIAGKLKDRDSTVRAAAIYSISEFGNKEYAGEIIKILENDHSYVRVCAAEALGKIGGDNEETLTALFNALSSDEELDVRLKAASSLRNLTGKDFGYNENSTPDQKYKAVQEWKTYLSERDEE